MSLLPSSCVWEGAVLYFYHGSFYNVYGLPIRYGSSLLRFPELKAWQYQQASVLKKKTFWIFRTAGILKKTLGLVTGLAMFNALNGLYVVLLGLHSAV